MGTLWRRRGATGKGEGAADGTPSHHHLVPGLLCPTELPPPHRRYVLTLLPQLSSLDFSAVTPQERREVAVWGGTQRRPRPH